METTTNPPRKFRDMCLCAAFLVFLIAPALSAALRRGEAAVNLVENRRAAEFPPRPASVRDWAEWPRAFEAWHADHFGLRATFLQAHNALAIFVLHTSPSPRIVVGREHWIFSTAMDLDQWRGTDPFTEKELEAWRVCLESRQQPLAELGIAYLFVLAPSKSAIYPEFLPANYRQGGISRTDQLIGYLSSHSNFRVLDLRAALLEEKRRDIGDDFTYFPLGTHWNARGMIAGLRPIVAELAKLWPRVGEIKDEIAEQVIDENDIGDSWAGRLYLPDALKQTVRRVILSDAQTREVKLTTLPDERSVIVDQDDASLPRGVVFHDSFGEPLQTPLGRHLSHAVFVWKPEIDMQLVLREKPDFVLQVFNDRVLSSLQPQAFHSGGDARVKARFEASQEIALRFDAATNSPPIKAYSAAGVSLRSEGGLTRVACKLDSAAGGFLLPEFKLRGGAHAILHLEFESPIAAGASFLFRTKSDPNYSRKRQLLFDVHQGTNVLNVELIDPELSGPLLFRPASEPGTFLVSALEVRLVSD